MNNNPFLSIIIPVYNGLSHDLKICLEHIFEKQFLEKKYYEVICVDDCSTDNTREWLKEHYSKYNNFVIIENKVNVRQGGARNNGVKVAQGKYILFIDQDDYYHAGCIDEIFKLLKNSDLDILVTDSAYHFKNVENNKLQLNFKYKDIMTGEEFIEKNGFVFAPWRVVLRKEYYLKHHFSFEENVRIEDVDWGCKVIRYAERIQYQPVLCVHYIQSETGTTDNMYRNKHILIDQIKAGKRVIDVANECYSESHLKKRVINVAEIYFNNSCKCMMGLICPFQDKVDIISLIPNSESHYAIVRIAKATPKTFAALSTVSVPIFRLSRKLYRWWKKWYM